jgi:hypothetical protein
MTLLTLQSINLFQQAKDLLLITDVLLLKLINTVVVNQAVKIVLHLALVALSHHISTRPLPMNHEFLLIGKWKSIAELAAVSRLGPLTLLGVVLFKLLIQENLVTELALEFLAVKPPHHHPVNICESILLLAQGALILVT